MGCQLFVRTRRGVELTHAGARALPSVEKAFFALTAAERDGAVSATVSGAVRVSSLEVVAHHILAPNTPWLLASYPQLQLELVGEALLADLERRQSDIGIRLIRPKGGDFIASGVDAGEFRAFVSARRQLRTDRVGAQDLRWIMWDHSVPATAEQDWLLREGATVSLRCSSSTLMVEAAIADSGAILLPERLGSRIDGLRRLELTGLPPMPVKLWIVTARALRRQPSIDAVWDWIRTVFDESP